MFTLETYIQLRHENYVLFIKFWIKNLKLCFLKLVWIIYQPWLTRFETILDNKNMSCNANTPCEEETGILLLCIVNKYNTGLIFFIRTYCDRHIAEMLLALCETTIGCKKDNSNYTSSFYIFLRDKVNPLMLYN